MQKSRRELMEWIRSLGIEMSRIEDLGKGVIICEILSAMHQDFPSNFVKNPVSEHEYLKNMKICQNFFGSKSIKLYFPVEKLIKCKMQDNLEVAQWLAKYYHKNGIKDVERKFEDDKKTTGSMNPRMISSDTKDIQVTRDSEAMLSSTDINVNMDLCSSNISEDLKAKDRKIQELMNTVAKMQCQIEQMAQNEEKLLGQVSQLKNELGSFCDKEVKSLLMTFEKERDFYFKKLFMIERYFLETEGLDENTKKDMFEILYEENGE